MYCDKCGAVVQGGQAFCSKCGKQIVGPVSLMQPLPGRVQGHVRLLALVLARILGIQHGWSGVLYMMANTFFVHMFQMQGPDSPRAFCVLC